VYGDIAYSDKTPSWRAPASGRRSACGTTRRRYRKRTWPRATPTGEILLGQLRAYCQTHNAATLL